MLFVLFVNIYYNCVFDASGDGIDSPSRFTFSIKRDVDELCNAIIGLVD